MEAKTFFGNYKVHADEAFTKWLGEVGEDKIRFENVIFAQGNDFQHTIFVMYSKIDEPEHSSWVYAGNYIYQCRSCGEFARAASKYCPGCGMKMIGVYKNAGNEE